MGSAGYTKEKLRERARSYVLVMSGKTVGIMEGYHTVRGLFCETGKEESVVERMHNSGLGRAIFARRSGTKREMGNGLKGYDRC